MAMVTRVYDSFNFLLCLASDLIIFVVPFFLLFSSQIRIFSDFGDLGVHQTGSRFDSNGEKKYFEIFRFYFFVMFQWSFNRLSQINLFVQVFYVLAYITKTMVLLKERYYLIKEKTPNFISLTMALENHFCQGGS